MEKLLYVAKWLLVFFWLYVLGTLALHVEGAETPLAVAFAAFVPLYFIISWGRIVTFDNNQY